MKSSRDFIKTTIIIFVWCLLDAILNEDVAQNVDIAILTLISMTLIAILYWLIKLYHRGDE